jgi:uncharacterized protein YndB with AHSA1/START domain
MSEIEKSGSLRPGASIMLALAGLRMAGPAAAAPPARTETATRTTIHQEVTIHASPMRVYEALLGSKSFATFTRMPARIDRRAGGATWMFGGLIAGRNIELVPGKRIVQAWRATGEWEPGVYSLVKFELRPRGAGTLVILDHTGFPAGNFDHLNAGWAPRYWRPLDKFLSASR